MSTTVSGPSIGAISGYAVSLSYALTATMTTSTGPILAGSDSAGACDDEVAELGAPHLQALRANRVQVSAARDEGHVLPGPGQPGAEVTAHGAGAQNRESHTA